MLVGAARSPLLPVEIHRALVEARWSVALPFFIWQKLHPATVRRVHTSHAALIQIPYLIIRLRLRLWLWLRLRPVVLLCVQREAIRGVIQGGVISCRIPVVEPAIVGLDFSKQKTAYVIMGGDWSSDVCSSD
eukprot:COSAG04_NODE_7170_length_1175_cov_1.538104_1_plen_131_part_01